MSEILEIEEKLNIMITMPQICHFCGEEITIMRGRKSKSLCFHSLDGNHDNWDPANKVPAHIGCHGRYHNEGEKHPMYGKHRSEKTKQKIRDAKLGKTFEQIHGEEKARELRIFSSERVMGDKNPNYGDKISPEEWKIRQQKTWDTRRKRYPPSGLKDPEAFGRAVSERKRKSNK